MKEIPLTQGKIVLVDDADYSALIKYKWHATKCCESWYARMSFTVRGTRIRIYMHRLLLGLDDPNILCDHKNGDGLDNQRINLRSCSKGENQRNKKQKRKSTHKYKGITKFRSNWVAQLSYKNKRVHIGTFKSDIDAAKAYNAKALELFGEFAKINHI